jgi:hypothetical protein
MHEYYQLVFTRIPKSTLKNDVIKLYKETNECLIVIFDSCNWKFVLPCDTWTAITNESYLCIKCHWIGLMMIDFCKKELFILDYLNIHIQVLVLLE